MTVRWGRPLARAVVTKSARMVSRTGGAGLPGVHGNTREAAGYNRHDPAFPAVYAEGGQPLQLLGEEHDHHQRQPELGHGDADHGDDHDALVTEAVAVHGGVDAKRYADAHVEQDTDPAQRQGPGNAHGKLLNDRSSVYIGGAEVKANKGIAQIAEHLRKKRIVQSVQFPIEFKFFLCSLLAQNQFRRVAGYKPHDGKDQKGHADRDQDEP